MLIQPRTPNKLVRTFMEGLDNRLNIIQFSFASVKAVPSADTEHHLITTHKASNEVIYDASDLNRIHFERRLQILRNLRIT
jgi:hypothetical protein